MHTYMLRTLTILSTHQINRFLRSIRFYTSDEDERGSHFVQSRHFSLAVALIKLSSGARRFGIHIVHNAKAVTTAGRISK